MSENMPLTRVATTVGSSHGPGCWDEEPCPLVGTVASWAWPQSPSWRPSVCSPSPPPLAPRWLCTPTAGWTRTPCVAAAWVGLATVAGTAPTLGRRLRSAPRLRVHTRRFLHDSSYRPGRQRRLRRAADDPGGDPHAAGGHQLPSNHDLLPEGGRFPWRCRSVEFHRHRGRRLGREPRLLWALYRRGSERPRRGHRVRGLRQPRRHGHDPGDVQRRAGRDGRRQRSREQRRGRRILGGQYPHVDRG